MKQAFITAILVLGIVVLGAWVWLRWFEYHSLYYPERDVTTTPARFQVRYQEVQFVAPDGVSLAGWWIPANRPCATVVYCSGNAGNIGHRAHLAPEFYRRGFNLLLWDYRGYGQSSGRPSEKGLYADATAAFDAAEALSGKLPVMVYGHSIGAAVAIQVACERPVAGLVVEAGFASAADLARRRFPRLPSDRLLSVSYDAAARAMTLSGLSKLFGHSLDDDVIPFQSGRILHGAAAAPKTFAILAGDHTHASWFSPGAPGNAELEAFLARFKP